MDETINFDKLCRTFRADVVRVLHDRQTGHPGGSLSCCEILTALYFCEMNVRPQEPHWPGRDRLVLSKGHAAPMLYRVLAGRGFFPVEEMHTLRAFDTRLQGHPCARSTPGVDLSTGPLGIGLAAAAGMAAGLRLDGLSARVYAVLGDGELNEGTVWEACMSAVKFRLDNLCAIVDWNRVQLDGACADIMPMDNLVQRFAAFGWRVVECDGHDVGALCGAFAEARRTKGGPTVVLARTVKGKGVSFMEGKNVWHGKPIDDACLARALEDLGGDRA